MTIPLRRLSEFSLAGLLLASGPCSNEAQPSARPRLEQAAPSSVPPTPASPAPDLYVVSTDPYVAAAQLVDAIRALPTLDRAALERLLGIPLRRSPGVAVDEEDYETPLPNGPFSALEVRTSNPRQQRFALVVLTIREGTVLTLPGLRATGRIREDMAIRPNVRVPPEGRMDFVDKTKDQEVDYSFWIKRQELVEVTIARPPSR